MNPTLPPSFRPQRQLMNLVDYVLLHQICPRREKELLDNVSWPALEDLGLSSLDLQKTGDLDTEQASCSISNLPIPKEGYSRPS